MRHFKIWQKNSIFHHVGYGGVAEHGHGLLPQLHRVHHHQVMGDCQVYTRCDEYNLITKSCEFSLERLWLWTCSLPPPPPG